MQADPLPGSVGYSSTFVEMFAWVLTPPAYRALWEILYPSINPYGWGYDLWYDNYAKARVLGHRMGIVSVMQAKHEQDFSLINNGRTDSASVEVKWKAVLRQQKFYEEHFGVNLNKKFNIHNTSWNGAVTGLLYEVGE